MTNGFLNSKCLPLAVCAAFASSPLDGLAQQKPAMTNQQVEASTSISDLMSSNFDALISGSDAKKDLSEAYKIKKPDSFNPIEPFSTWKVPPVRPPPPSIKSKQIMDLLQKRKDWVFLEPNEKAFGLTAEDIFKIHDKSTKGDESEKEDMTALERFYHRKDGRDDQDGGRTNSLNGANEATNKNGLFNLDRQWSGQSDSQAGLPVANFFQSPNDEASSTFRKPAALADNSGRFNPGKAQINISAGEDAERAQKGRMDEFKKLLDTYYASPSGGNSAGGGWSDPADPWNISSPRPVVSSRQVAPPSSTAKNPFEFQSVGGAIPGLPQGYQDISTLSGFSSLAPALPAQEDRRLTMPQPVFTRPVRRF